MKLVLVIGLVLLSIFAFATEVQVSHMKKSPGYDERFDLKSNFNESMMLDCQSFVQGLLFGQDGESVIMLQEWECEDLVTDMKKSHLKFKKHCLELDFDNGLLEGQKTCD